MNRVARDRELYLENYWLKNKRAIDKGRNGPTYAWVIPAGQRRKADAADMVNDLRRQGAEVHRATAGFKAGNVDVAPGDYIIRADQPYRTLVDMYFSVQNYPPANPRPYDDTGWTMPYMRNVKVTAIAGKAILDQAMTVLTVDAKAAGGVDGSGVILIVEHTSDNNLMSFRYQNKDVEMQVAEEDFDLNGASFPRRRVRHRERRPRASRAHGPRPGAFRVGRGNGAVRQDARIQDPAHRLRAFLVANPG